MGNANHPTAFVETDDYGTVTRGQWAAYKKFNVTPAESDNLRTKFGSDQAAAIRFVKEHVSDAGNYREPWPFPLD
jgi:hypothetical protein